MRRKGIVVFVLLIFCLGFLPQGSNANGLEVSNDKEISSYTYIQYNGEKQEIVLNEDVSLTLTGWADESKSSVKGQMDIHTDSMNRMDDTTIEVGKELHEIAITGEESIYYRVDASDSFKVEQVNPQEIHDQMTVVTENENGTSIEEVRTVDEYDTVIEDKGLTYYSTVENNQKVVVSKEEYESLNTMVDSAPVVEPSENVAPAKEESSEKEVPLISAQSLVENPSITYSTHVQNIGWQEEVTNGELSGTQGQSKRLESIKISIDHVEDLGVEYSTHVQDRGWLEFVSNGKESGTTGQAKRLEAIKIQLTGKKAANYDVFYRVHAQDYGWLGWAMNGQSAGTEGLAKRLEAIEIVLVEKGGEAPELTEKPFISKPSVVYTTHVETYGWLDYVSDGALGGTSGRAKRLEAIKINLQAASYTGGITYSTHVQDYGWLNNVSNDEISGTSGKSKRLEAIKIDLTGEIANYFDVYYRVHTQDYGWLGWAKNGMKAGTEGLSKRLEAIEIKLVPKGQGEAVNGKAAFKQPLTVFLDPGHGGTDPGATAGGYKEADLNLAVAKKVKSLLVNLGYNVVMSRTNNSTVELLDRPKMANAIKADIFVSIHTNSTGTSSTSAAGIEGYYYKYFPEYPSKINTEMHNNPVRISKSMTLTNLIQDNMVNYTDAVDRGTFGETFLVVREAAMPATLVEMGFINNASERQQLIKDSYQTKLAKAIADGIDKYFTR